MQKSPKQEEASRSSPGQMASGENVSALQVLRLCLRQSWLQADQGLHIDHSENEGGNFNPFGYDRTKTLFIGAYYQWLFSPSQQSCYAKTWTMRDLVINIPTSQRSFFFEKEIFR